MDAIIIELAKYGPLGVILAWFMFRTEHVLERLGERIDDLTIATGADATSPLAVAAVTRAQLRRASSRRRSA